MRVGEVGDDRHRESQDESCSARPPIGVPRPTGLRRIGGTINQTATDQLPSGGATTSPDRPERSVASSYRDERELGGDQGHRGVAPRTTCGQGPGQQRERHREDEERQAGQLGGTACRLPRFQGRQEVVEVVLSQFAGHCARAAVAGAHSGPSLPRRGDHECTRATQQDPGQEPQHPQCHRNPLPKCAAIPTMPPRPSAGRCPRSHGLLSGVWGGVVRVRRSGR